MKYQKTASYKLFQNYTNKLKGLGYHNPFIWNLPSPGFVFFVCFIMSLSRREQSSKSGNNKKVPSLLEVLYSHICD